MSLNTGRTIHRHQWKRLNITQHIIDKVDAIGTRDKQSVISNNFKYRLGNNQRVDYVDNDDKSIAQSVNSETSSHKSIQSIMEFNTIADKINEIIETNKQTNYDEVDNEAGLPVNDESNDEAESLGEAQENEVEDALVPSEVVSNEHDMEQEANEDLGDTIEESTINEVAETMSGGDKNETESQSSTSLDASVNVNDTTEEAKDKDHPYNLRSHGQVNCRDMHRYGETQLMQIQKQWIRRQVNTNSKSKTVNMKSDDLYRRTVGTILTQISKVDKYAQVSVNEGIKRHGDRAIAAVLTEFNQ